MVEQGALKVNIDKAFPLEQAGEALSYLQEDHPKGKVVIKIK
jgi:NADPH:quinone reductase-like Zn-dependent oxidoreductase